ncbi:MAG: hypothetical protein U9R39_03705 [Campylobacterota bacterium]|nr:hypothetical protein [Campylobacterota bacterium]
MMHNYKIISFYNFASSMGIKTSKKDNKIELDELLFNSFIFLNQSKVVTNKQKLEYNIFKDRYNTFLKYAIKNNLIEKDKFLEIKSLNITCVPDMSKIKLPDISKELKDMNIDIDKLSGLFKGLS